MTDTTSTTASASPSLLDQFLQQYQAQQANPTSASPASTTPAGQQSMQAFANTPMYGLMYGQQNAANQAAAMGNGTYDPTTAFQNDPGYQYNTNQALQQVQRAGAASGMLESGAMNQQMLNTAQNSQNQQYQTWLGQQNSLFNNYQNQLASMAQFGSTQTGGAQAAANGTTLAQLIASLNSTGGTTSSGVNMATGQDIASLYANQGSLNANAILSTAAAQAQNIFNGNSFMSQIQAANLGAANQGANSALAGAGAQAGYNTNKTF